MNQRSGNGYQLQAWLLRLGLWSLTASNSSTTLTLINHNNSSKTPFQNTRLVVSRGNSSEKQFVIQLKRGKTQQATIQLSPRRASAWDPRPWSSCRKRELLPSYPASQWGHHSSPGDTHVAKSPQPLISHCECYHWAVMTSHKMSPQTQPKSTHTHTKSTMPWA